MSKVLRAVGVRRPGVNPDSDADGQRAEADFNSDNSGAPYGYMLSGRKH